MMQTNSRPPTEAVIVLAIQHGILAIAMCRTGLIWYKLSIRVAAFEVFVQGVKKQREIHSADLGPPHAISGSAHGFVKVSVALMGKLPTTLCHYLEPTESWTKGKA